MVQSERGRKGGQEEGAAGRAGPPGLREDLDCYPREVGALEPPRERAEEGAGPDSGSLRRPLAAAGRRD